MKSVDELCYIRGAMEAGAKMLVEQSLPNECVFRAVMRWEGDVPIYGPASTSVSGALKNLDWALQEDLMEAAR